MKKLFSILALISLASCAAPALVQFTENEYLVKIFEDIPGSQDELYLKANNWMIETFNSAESVIQHSDKDAGVIIGKYLMHGSATAGLYASLDTRIYAIIDIRVKDGKARLEIKPQGKWQYDKSGMTIYDYSKEEAIAEMEQLTESLYNYLLKDNIDF